MHAERAGSSREELQPWRENEDWAGDDALRRGAWTKGLGKKGIPGVQR